MARVRFAGTEIAVDVIEKTPDGDYFVRARQHGPRTSIGTLIRVKRSEFTELKPTEDPGTPQFAAVEIENGIVDKVAEVASQAALDKAMAEERKTLPSPADLIAQHRANIAEGKTLPGRPTQPRTTGPQPQTGTP